MVLGLFQCLGCFLCHCKLNIPLGPTRKAQGAECPLLHGQGLREVKGQDVTKVPHRGVSFVPELWQAEIKGVQHSPSAEGPCLLAFCLLGSC